MEYTLSQLFSLFFIYSLAGWLLDTAAATIFRREWINKGYLSLPLCPIYGVQAVAFTLFLSEVAATRKTGGSDAGSKPALLGRASRRWLSLSCYGKFAAHPSHSSVQAFNSGLNTSIITER